MSQKELEKTNEPLGQLGDRLGHGLIAMCFLSVSQFGRGVYCVPLNATSSTSVVNVVAADVQVKPASVER
jgi:hypothetical protein